MTEDNINPAHYKSHPSGIECITITRHHNFNIGNAIKYLWRGGLKSSAPVVEDLKKAIWYIQDEIDQLEAKSKEDDWWAVWDTEYLVSYQGNLPVFPSRCSFEGDDEDYEITLAKYAGQHAVLGKREHKEKLKMMREYREQHG